MASFIGMLLIFFFSILFPFVSIGGFIVPVLAYVRAPRWIDRMGWDIRDEVARFLIIAGTLTIALWIAPPVFLSMNGALLTLAPLAAVVCLLVGILWAVQGESAEFGERFWTFGRHSLVLAALFSVALAYRYHSRFSSVYDVVATMPSRRS